MSNTLTNLIPDIYLAMDVVSRELTGFIPAVTRDSRAEQAAVGQTIRSFVAPASTSTNITPGVTAPDSGDQAILNKTLTISKSKMVPVRVTGEEQRGLNSLGGVGYSNLLGQQFEQAMRTLANEIEADIATLYPEASRAATTTGTTIFDATAKLSDFANVRKILVDNGAPLSDLQLVIGTTEGAALRSLTQLTNANEAGSTNLLRQGVLIEPIAGLAVRESAQILSHTKGTGASATTDSTGYVVGSTVIGLASAGTGTMIPGDVFTLTGDTNQYTVVSGDIDVSNGGSITIAAPGLRVALPASPVNITMINKPRRNIAFARSAIQLVTRVPAYPDGGDMAIDRQIITDPRSGLSFDISVYKQYKQVHYEVGIAWGFAAMKPEHMALLIG